MLVLEDIGFQLQQRKTLSPRPTLLAIAMLPSPWSHFCMLFNLDVHPTSRNSKTMWRNATTSMANHKNKWENAKSMDAYYVVWVTPIPYPCFGVTINIVSKEDNTYRVTIGGIPNAHVWTSPKCQLKLWRKKWMYCKHLHYVFICLCKVDFKNNEFIHASTSKYNKVMCLLELASVVQGFILVSIFVILWQSKISHYCGWNLLRFIIL